METSHLKLASSFLNSFEKNWTHKIGCFWAFWVFFLGGKITDMVDTKRVDYFNLDFQIPEDLSFLTYICLKLFSSGLVT